VNSHKQNRVSLMADTIYGTFTITALYHIVSVKEAYGLIFDLHNKFYNDH